MLPVKFVGPVEEHGLSDNVGVEIFKISKGYGNAHHEKLRDELSGSINSLRTEVLIAKSDLVLAYFDIEHGNLRQWSPTADIAAACSSGKPLILVADGSLGHALKELCQQARVWVYTLQQAFDLISYITTDKVGE